MSEVNDIRSVNLPHVNGRWLLTGHQVELDTVAAPPLFLHHCDANVAKNVADVISTSIRNLVYKAFERGANIGDVTVKGLCVFDLNCVFNKYVTAIKMEEISLHCRLKMINSLNLGL
ncbi:root UVB sensitive 6-like protein isoform X2 [Tanacetum coccineum]